MLGKLLKRKRKKEEKKTKIRGLDGEQLGLDEAPKSEKKKKSKESEGSRWAALVVLILTIVAGLVFWLYGEMAGTGYVGDKPEVEDEKVPVGKVVEEKARKMREGETVDLNKEGVIIFEK